MPKIHAYAMFLIALSILSTAATGQNIYKCGNSYSQAPCPGGAVIDVTDQRTSDQKRQTDMAASRDVKTADSMEKLRLQQEKEDRIANRSTVPPTKTVVAIREASPKVKKKKKVPRILYGAGTKRKK